MFASLDFKSIYLVCALFLKKLFICVGKPSLLYDSKFSPKKKGKGKDVSYVLGTH